MVIAFSGSQWARTRTWENPRFWLWWCQTIVLYPNRTAKWVLFHIWSCKIFFWFFEKLEFLLFFKKSEKNLATSKMEQNPSSCSIGIWNYHLAPSKSKSGIFPCPYASPLWDWMIPATCPETFSQWNCDFRKTTKDRIWWYDLLIW